MSDSENSQNITAKEGGIVKNVLQAIIQIPGWALVVGAISIAIGFVLTGLAISVGPSLLPTPSPLSTPVAFSVASPDETLLVIADFDNRAGSRVNIDPAQRIYNLITEKLPGQNIKLRVEQYHVSIKDTAEAHRVLKAYGATLLIWGWYDQIGAEPAIELDKDKIRLANPKSPEFSLATPESFVIRFTREIPAQVGYTAFFALGMMQFQLGVTEIAQKFFTQAIDSARETGTGAINPWEALMWRGNIYVWSREYGLAITDYSEALNLHPHKEGYFNRGSAYGGQDQYDLAIADYSKAIEIDPTDKGAYFNRGIAYWGQDQYDLAIADYSKAIELDLAYKNAYFTRGSAYRELGQYDLAIADYSKAIELDPNFAGAYVGRGNVYADGGKFSEAIADYQKSISLDPSPYAYCVMGITYTKKGDFASAIAALEEGVKLDVQSQFLWCKTALDNARQGIPTP